MKNKQKLEAKTLPELYELLTSLKKEQFMLRLQLKSGQLSDNSRMKVSRRSVAQVLTWIGDMKKDHSKCA